ncbi:unnamed protein product [Prorocentrum cordatum]|uniref:Uncharacterized protein n=1 Tax=Prorocentrum cordatum TaxID=2364126 RepID=A0ABN9WXQ0_9DINO|nr:unnamed protein product [Polarella glacialis]
MGAGRRRLRGRCAAGVGAALCAAGVAALAQRSLRPGRPFAGPCRGLRPAARELRQVEAPLRGAAPLRAALPVSAAPRPEGGGAAPAEG